MSHRRYDAIYEVLAPYPMPSVLIKLVNDYTNDGRQRILDSLDRITGVKGEALCALIAEYQARIVGSFPLACLLDDDYGDISVDIFMLLPPTPTTTRVPLSQKISQLLGTAITPPLTVIRQPHITNTCSVSTKRGPSVVINICTTEAMHWCDIFDGIDISMCKTTYDGYSNRIFTMDAELVAQKRGYLCRRRILKGRDFTNKQVISTARRVDVYETRGFRITQDPRTPRAKRKVSFDAEDNEAKRQRNQPAEILVQ